MPDPALPGCPLRDRDRDGVLDPADQCPDVAQGEVPDPAKPGCPAGDRDRDSVQDPLDACPDQPGAPNPDPKKNGCPGLVAVQGGKIVIVKPVFFATNKEIILTKSHPVLESVANALKASPQIKKVRIEGHTDDRGKAAVDPRCEQSPGLLRRADGFQKPVRRGRIRAAAVAQPYIAAGLLLQHVGEILGTHAGRVIQVHTGFAHQFVPDRGTERGFR